ncbi:hypothetical protein Syun_025346 [Stephania yunnanensis]|uniref:Uncharacterized protein n=1 Tax=Stephania yunnanensis TaxID=152371 RepID=A0AAP0ERI5_9MAGN
MTSSTVMPHPMTKSAWRCRDSATPTLWHPHSVVLDYLPTCPNRLRLSSSSSSRFAGQGRKDRESEGEAVKLEVKTRCAEALRFLLRGNLSNSTRITEKKGLLVLARHVENERGELQLHCLF